MTYKLIKDISTNKVNQVKLTSDTTNLVKIVPFVPGNTDYQEYLEWIAEGNTAEEPSVEDDWKQVRGRRDGLLAGSDWTMTTGATIDQAQWSAYREKLRDIPQTYKNVSHPLTEVVWPTTPSSKGPNS